MNISRFAARLLLISISALCIHSCAKYDDSALKSQVEELARRVSKLEESCSSMNSNMIALQTVISAIQGEDRLTGVTPVYKNSVLVGYSFTFSKSGTVTIYNGTDGKDGTDGRTPEISIKQFTDGEWYWTLDGSWMLTPTGQKIKASASAPQLAIRDGYWYISTDNGKTWEKLDKATGDSFFKSVNETSTAVVLTLADGTVITIPKIVKVVINFDDSKDIAIMPGGQRTISYTLSNVAGTSIVKAIAQNGWRAKVEPSSNTSGKIIVNAPAELTDDEIIVLVYDGEYSMVMASLNFMKGTISLSDDNFEIPGAGGSVSTTVSTNVGMKVSIPQSASSWISYKTESATKAMEQNRVTFTVTKNTTEGDRSAVVTISDEGGVITKTVMFYQKEYDQYVDITGGGETANCYIINNPGDYKFPIIKGNGQKGVIISGDTAEIPDAVSASIVWQDASIVQAVGIRKGYVVFTTTSSAPHGNAVVAVSDSNGQILWSWHIWSTDYVLGEGDVTVSNYSKTNSYKMMPLNLGAKSKSTSSSSWKNSDGAVFYQFGRKDPFPNKTATKTAENGSLALSIANPDTYYTWNNWTDWCSDMRMDWWDAGSTSTSNYANSSASDANVILGVKTIYDPCPPGYRVAPDDAFTGFTKTGIAVTSDSQVNGSFNTSSFAYTFNTGSGNVNFKLCGGLNASAGTLLTGIGYYQTAHAGGYGIQRQLILEYGGVNPMCATYSRALAGAVRPIKDTYVKPYESTDYSSNGTMLTIQNHTVGNGIKVVIAGDGYTDKDIASGLYDSDMKKASNYLFSVEPFKSYRNRFDVIDYRAVSATELSYGNTAFSTKFGTGTHITGNLSNAYNCAYKAFNTISDVLIIIVINSKRYAGTCYMATSGTSVAFCPASQDYYTFEDVVHHEAGGHGFGFLGDEYYYSGTISTSEASDVKSLYEGSGWYANIDVVNDPSTIRWANFLSDATYGSRVGIYEGAYTYAYGAYRPTQNSIMNANKGTYNAPSRYAIFKRIMTLSGETPSWSKFVSYDTINLSSSSNAYNSSDDQVPADFVPLAPPVIVDPQQIMNNVDKGEAKYKNGQEGAAR